MRNGYGCTPTSGCAFSRTIPTRRKRWSRRTGTRGMRSCTFAAVGASSGSTRISCRSTSGKSSSSARATSTPPRRLRPRAARSTSCTARKIFWTLTKASGLRGNRRAVSPVLRKAPHAPRGGAPAERTGEPCRNRGPARVLQPKQLHPRVQARIRHDAARVPPHALPPDGAHGGMTRSRRAGRVPGFPRRNAHKKNIKRKTEALCHIAAVLPFFASGSAALAETARRRRRPSRPFRSGPGSIRFASSFRPCTAP